MCQRIRERAEWRHIKIIMLSAKGRDAEVNKGLAMGADLYVTKPFSTRELMAKIERAARAASRRRRVDDGAGRSHAALLHVQHAAHRAIV